MRLKSGAVKMRDLHETGINHIAGDNFVTFFSSERKWINRIRKLKEEFPNEVDIKHENPDGSLVAHIPTSWFQIKPRKKIQFTEEQILAAKARLEKGRLKRLAMIGVDDVHVGQERNQ